MVPSATSSKYKKAIIQVLDAKGKVKEEISVRFNPTEYSMETSNEFSNINIPGLESPLLQFVRGGLDTLSMDLFFDTYEENKKDVRKLTDKITGLLKINKDLHAPPIVRFVWANLNFTAVLARVNQKYTMFLADGTPVRATLTVTFNEYKTEAELRKPTSSPDRTKVYMLKQGDSLWAIAKEEYGDQAKWRAIADANDINNPRELPIGEAIKIPALEE